MGVMWMLCAIFALSVAVVSAAKSAAPPPVDCSSLVLNMADCLSFVTAGSTTKKPEGTCCSGLKTVLKSDAECLCEAFRNSAQLGVTLNITKATTLPAACHVSAPSVANCGLSIGTGDAPAVSPSSSAASPTSGAETPSPSVGASEVAPGPSPAPAAAGAPSLAASVVLLIVCVVAAVAPF